jgi:hypothetical protein
MIATADLAWVAALVEGEGYLGFVAPRAGRRSLTPRIVVHMADRDIIERLAGFWGCAVRARKKQRPHHKQQYKAQVSSTNAIAWAATLYHWLGARRRARVREMLTAWKGSAKAFKHRTHCPAGHAYAGRNLIRRVTPQGTGRQCRACLYVRIKDHARRHPRERREYQQRWRREHPERVREYERRSRTGRGDARQLGLAL